jgi:uncharacterized membrane protein YfcA
LIPLGFAVAMLGTVVGAGGGFLLVPALLLLYPDRDPETITSMSLFVVFVNSLSATVAFARSGRIDYRSGIWFVAATMPGAIGGAILVHLVPRAAFDVLFAIVLGTVGIWLALRRPGTAIRQPLQGRGVVSRSISDRRGHVFVYSYRLWHGLASCAAIGFISSLLGIGGGVMQMPVMVTLLHFPVHIAAATSHFVLTFMSGGGTAVHAASGTLHWDQSMFEAVLLAVGAVPGAQAGALLAQRIRAGVILRALAACLVLLAIRLALMAVWA